MMSTIYCNLKNKKTEKNIYSTLENYYRESFFVKILTNNNRLDFFSVQNTNNCLITLFKHPASNKIIIVSLIDNLLKGAAGQAIQCFNKFFDFKETLSLEKFI